MASSWRAGSDGYSDHERYPRMVQHRGGRRPDPSMLGHEKFYRVGSATATGTAPQQPGGRHADTLPDPMGLQRLDRVLRAARREPADRRPVRTDLPLVQAD